MNTDYPAIVNNGYSVKLHKSDVWLTNSLDITICYDDRGVWYDKSNAQKALDKYLDTTRKIMEGSQK